MIYTCKNEQIFLHGFSCTFRWPATCSVNALKPWIGGGGCEVAVNIPGFLGGSFPKSFSTCAMICLPGKLVALFSLMIK